MRLAGPLWPGGPHVDIRIPAFWTVNVMGGALQEVYVDTNNTCGHKHVEMQLNVTRTRFRIYAGSYPYLVCRTPDAQGNPRGVARRLHLLSQAGELFGFEQIQGQRPYARGLC